MRSMITPVVALLSIAVATTQARAQIPWNNDLQAAHAQAKQEGKRLLMHFYTDNCVFCERLEAGAFQSPVLAAAIEKNFVPVKIHAGMNPKIAKTFRVTRFPTDVIVTTDGTVLAHGVSPQDPNKFAGMLAQHAPSSPSEATLAQAEPPRSNPSAPEPQATRNDRLPSHVAANVSTMAGSMPTANPYAPSVDFDQRSQSSSEKGFSLPTNLGGTSANVAAYRPRNNPTPEYEADDSSADVPPSNATRPIPVTSGPAMESEDIEIAPKLESDLLPQTASGTSEKPGSEKPNVEKTADKAPSQSVTPPVALQGFCPVALLENEEWVAGDAAFGAIHLGQLYLFADEASLGKFRNDPESYTPVMNGNDVVLFFEEHRVVEGRRDWGLVDPEFNRIFFFATEETMNHFYEHHQDYVRSAITVTRQAAAEANSKHR